MYVMRLVFVRVEKVWIGFWTWSDFGLAVSEAVGVCVRGEVGVMRDSGGVVEIE